MAIFTVLTPPGIASPARRADRTVFLRDGFSWWAFWFGPMALAYRRLWLATLAWLALATLIAIAAATLALSALATTTAFVLLALLTGLETSAWREAALRRRGYVFAALLARPTRDAAEQAFFHGEEGRVPAPQGGPATKPRLPSTGVIGLFPDDGT